MEYGRVQEIGSPTEYAQALLVATAAQRLTVVDFSAKWCGPCNAIAPVFVQLSNKYTDVEFVKVDVDGQQEIAAAHGITAMPTFVFIKNGKRIDELRGANAVKLEQLIQHHSGVKIEEEEESDLKLPAGHSEVTTYVDKVQGECLNQSADHKWNNIFQKDDSYLESDTDEQLLIYIPFMQPIKIHSLCFQAPTDGRAPQTVNLYANARNMDFQSVDSAPATQEITLQTEDIAGDKLIPLRFVKFQNVSSITIFVENNQGGEPTTAIQRLRFIGQTQAATNMNEFKRVAGEKGEVHG